jgi:hypothetical protein
LVELQIFPWFPVAATATRFDGHLETSVVAHNAASSACEKGYRWPWALQVLNELRGKQQVQGIFSMGKSWENDEHQGIFHGKMRAQGFFSWENHGKNMETKPSMNDICAIAMI